MPLPSVQNIVSGVTNSLQSLPKVGDLLSNVTNTVAKPASKIIETQKKAWEANRVANENLKRETEKLLQTRGATQTTNELGMIPPNTQWKDLNDTEKGYLTNNMVSAVGGISGGVQESGPTLPKPTNGLNFNLESADGEKRLLVDLFPDESIRGKGITKARTIEALDNAYKDGHNIVEPSNGMWTKEGWGFIKHLEDQGYIKQIPNRGGILRFEITPQSSLTPISQSTLSDMGTPVFRGTPESGKGTGFGAYGKGLYVTNNENIAKTYAGKSGNVQRYNIDESKLLDAEKYKIDGDIKKFFEDQYKQRGYTDEMAKDSLDRVLSFARENKDKINYYRGELEYVAKQVGLTDQTTEELASLIKKKGFDGIKYLSAPELEGDTGVNYVLYNKNPIKKKT